MKKEKFHIEYIFDKVSRRSLWNHLTTALGLSAWFADEVIINDNLYTFKWSKRGPRGNSDRLQAGELYPLPLGRRGR
ncbi:START-like domain-containing protein [Parabacteroides distasonis]|nr:START-like domain-containing protein [Parabacteroides distasonis]